MITAYPLLAAALAFEPASFSLPLEAQHIGEVSAGPDQVVTYAYFVSGGEYGVIDTDGRTVSVNTPPAGTAHYEAQLMQLPPPWGTVVACNDRDTGHIDVCTTGETILAGQRVQRTEDVNGDGYDDIFTTDALFVHDGTTWQEHPHPELHDTWLPQPLGDVDDDGMAEMWVPQYTEVVWRGYYYEYRAMQLHIHRFEGSGFAPEPTWTLDIDGIVIDALALQLDDDPERELLLAVASEVTDLDNIVNLVTLVTVDLGEAPVFTELDFVVVFDRWPEIGWADPLHAIGDINGDGYEDAVVEGITADYYGTGDPTFLRVLGSSNGWNVLEPLVPLPVDEAFGRGHAYDTTTVDLNGDGRLDIVSVRENEHGSEYPATVQVWFAPWLEADPVLPHTGDTGATGDTSLPSTSAMGDTGRGATADPPGHASAKEGSCGCQASPTTTLWSFLARRRRGATSTASGSACPPAAARVQRATRALLVDYPVCNQAAAVSHGADTTDWDSAEVEHGLNH